MLDKLLKTDFPDILSNRGFLIVWLYFLPQIGCNNSHQWKLFSSALFFLTFKFTQKGKVAFSLV